MINENFVLLGASIAFLGSLSYLIDTVKGRVKPNKVSFLIWALAPLIAFFVQIKEGVGIQALMTFTVGFLPLTIFIASFFNKKAEWKLKKFDFVCGLFSLVGLVLWLITKNGILAITFSILADSLASLPTIIKSYHFPETESGYPYLASAISAVITLLTLKTWNIMYSGFPIYVLIVCILIYVLVQFKIGKRLKASL